MDRFTRKIIACTRRLTQNNEKSFKTFQILFHFFRISKNKNFIHLPTNLGSRRGHKMFRC